METLNNFESLVERCAMFDEHKHDSVVRSDEFHFDADGNLVIAGEIGGLKLRLEDRALGQLSGRLGSVFWESSKRVIPLDVYRQLYTTFPNHFSALTNELLEAVNDKFLIRGYDDHARAFLSSQYVTLDNQDLLEMASEVLDGLDYEIIQSGAYYARNDGVQRDEMALRVVVKTVLPPDEGGGYGLGVLIRNGETGGAATEVRPLIMRTSCMNSLVFKVGEQGESLGIRLTHRGQKSAKIMLLASAIAEALPMAEAGLERFLQTKRQKLDLGAVIAGLGQEQGWSEQVKLAVASGSEGRESVYGLINGITYAAHEIDCDTSARLDMESLAAGFVYNPKAALAFQPRESVLVRA